MARTRKEQNYSLILIVIAAIVVIAGLIFYIQRQNLKKKIVERAHPFQVIPTPTPTPIPAETIMMVLHGFVPETLTIKRGTYVNFGNFIDKTIDIEADPQSKNSSMLNIGKLKVNDTSDPYFFKEAGTYLYYDAANPSKKGKIVVK